MVLADFPDKQITFQQFSEFFKSVQLADQVGWHLPHVLRVFSISVVLLLLSIDSRLLFRNWSLCWRNLALLNQSSGHSGLWKLRDGAAHPSCLVVASLSLVWTL